MQSSDFMWTFGAVAERGAEARRSHVACPMRALSRFRRDDCFVTERPRRQRHAQIVPAERPNFRCRRNGPCASRRGLEQSWAKDRAAGPAARGREPRRSHIAAPLPALAAAEARVAIVGAGLAGLTAAHELSKAGLKSTVYEGSTRLGGRCYTIRSFPNQIAEHGGEFIDSSHEAIRGLAACPSASCASWIHRKRASAP